jgi:hypothetical protein
MLSFKEFIKEETQSAGDGVRGFGDVSGNPAVDVDPLQQYITTNELAKDKENGALMKMMKNSQLKYNPVGFKSFDPRTKGKK